MTIMQRECEKLLRQKEALPHRNCKLPGKKNENELYQFLKVIVKSHVHFLSFWTQKEKKTEPKERKTVNPAGKVCQGFRP